MKNVIPIKNDKPRSDWFPVYTGQVDVNNQVVEKAKVGIAFMKPNSKTFRLKLWMFEGVQYFIKPAKDDLVSYNVIAHEEYELANGEKRTNWNKVGEGIYFGNYIRLNFYLFSESFFLSLFPTTTTECNETESEAA